MSRIPIVVGIRPFTQKSEAVEACREILYRYQLGERITRSADEQFLLDLLDLHPMRDDKIGCGIAHFEVRVNPRFVRQRTFYLVRVDGSETDFSFKKCLSPPTHRKLVLDAMRHEVVPQVFEFAERMYGAGYPVLCAITECVVERADAHVDHDSPTFLELANRFAVKHGGWEAIDIARADRSIGVQLGRGDQANAWREYHRAHARLRIVCVEANLSLLRRGAKRRI